MRSLDLLVAIDTWNTATTGEAHYILPGMLPYERSNLSPHFPPLKFFPGSWGQYTAPIVLPPEGAEVTDDWYVFWSLAKRLGLPLEFCGKPLPTDGPVPEKEWLIELYLANGQTTLAELKQFPHGRQFPIAEAYVQLRRRGHDAKFDVMPDDVRAELEQYKAAPVAAERIGSGAFTHLLTVRRMRDVMNSVGTQLQSVRKRNRYNPASMNSASLAELGLAPDQIVEIISAHGRTRAVLALDESLRDGVVSLSHGWGGARDKEDVEADGTNVNALIDTDVHYEAINAMPHMSAVPVRIMKAA